MENETEYTTGELVLCLVGFASMMTMALFGVCVNKSIKYLSRKLTELPEKKRQSNAVLGPNLCV